MTEREEALERALDQIAVAFGKEENLTDAQRVRRANMRLAKLEDIRACMELHVEENNQRDPDERGWTPLPPIISYIIGWYLRKEAASDHVIAESPDCFAASDALEEVARHK